MHLPSLLGHAAQIVRLIERSQRPSDALASEYFREKKYIGAKERRFVSALVFASLRGRSAFEFCSLAAFDLHSEEFLQFYTDDGGSGALHKKTGTEIAVHELGVVTACVLVGNYVGTGNIFEPLSELIGVDFDDEEGRIIAVGEAFASKMGVSEESGISFAVAVVEAWSQLAEETERAFSTADYSETALEHISTRFAMPYWILEAWQEGTVAAGDWFSAAEIAASLLGPAPVSLRVNSLAGARDAVAEALREEGIRARAGLVSPDALLIDRRVNIVATRLYREGIIEIQDEASQLAAFALAPKPGWRTLDACAGAGGKTLHIGAIQRNKGDIIAADIEYQRLKELRPRAKRSGISIVQTAVLREKHLSPEALPQELQRLESACDGVLIDAPCSGTGVSRRMPMAKWRLTPELLDKHARKQRAILQSFSRATAPGGTLVYATCSLMPQENIAVVRDFLAANPNFQADALLPALEKYGAHIPGLARDAAFATLTPAAHGTDGFFLARLKRIE